MQIYTSVASFSETWFLAERGCSIRVLGVLDVLHVSFSQQLAGEGASDPEACGSGDLGPCTSRRWTGRDEGPDSACGLRA